MSPELLLKKKHYGKPADVWALGVLLYYMMTNRFPYYARSEEELIAKVQDHMPDLSEIRKKSQEAADLLDRVFVFEPCDRIRAYNMIDSAFLSS